MHRRTNTLPVQLRVRIHGAATRGRHHLVSGVLGNLKSEIGSQRKELVQPMKKIIDGRRYDTSGAKRLAETSDGNCADPNYWRETLYRKSTGEYFIHGEGGPMSRYATPAGQNGWTSGERIMPVSLEDAQKWAEGHLTKDECKRLFGAVNDGNTKRIATYSLTEATIEKIARMAVERNCTKSDVVEQLVSG